MNQQKHINVLFIYRAMIPANFCLHQLFDYMSKNEMIQYRAVQEMRLNNQILDWADIVYMARFDSWYEEKLSRKMKETGDITVYYIDDDLPNIPSSIQSSRYYGRKEIKNHILASISNSQAIISPSLQLIEKYATDGKQSIQFHSSVFNTVEYNKHNPEHPIKIGFAGSLDRTSDIETMLKEALIAVKKKYMNNVEFEFFGAIPRFAQEIDAVCIPYENSYLRYREKMNLLEWDIGLAPMPDSAFYACKHYNKFLEYAAAGVAGIYSDYLPYVNIPNKEKVGCFCKNTTEDWYKAICLEVDDYERKEMHRKNSIQVAREFFNSKLVTKDLLTQQTQILESLIRQSSSKAHRLPFVVLKFGNIVSRGTGFIKQNGWSVFTTLPGKIKGRINSSKYNEK